jgi:hypothetical protein
MASMRLIVGMVGGGLAIRLRDLALDHQRPRQGATSQ